MKNGLFLFLVQDSDRPLYLFATDFAHALKEWELQMRRENEFAEGESVPGPDGVQCIAGPENVLQPPWNPPTDAEVEGCDVDSLRSALFARNNDVERIANERDEARAELEQQRTRAEAAEAEVAAMRASDAVLRTQCERVLIRHPSLAVDRTAGQGQGGAS